jgi:hypothetical protein
MSYADREKKREAGLKRARLSDQVDRKVQAVVKRVTNYERILNKLETLLTSSSHNYANAVTQKDRNHAFEEFTEQIVQIRLATCSIIEGVVAWRQALQELLEMDRGELDISRVDTSKKPFIWDGRNVLLALVTNLDFLNHSKELVEWYGRELPLQRNPFMLAVPMEERPPTPQSAMRRVLVDGKQVLRVSEKLVAKRIVQVEKMDKAWKQINAGPNWWPKCSSNELWMRIRICEKILAVEIDLHARLKSVVLSQQV